MKLAPSILASDLSDIRAAIKKCENAGADFIHWDVMDAHFVPNLTFGTPVIAHARKHTELPFDVHLMVTDPGDYLDELANIGVEMASFHIEAESHAERLLGKISSLGMKAGIALNPQTPPSAVEYLLGALDFVLVMTVNPGFAGQAFIDACVPKIERLSEIRRERGLDFAIQVDGGVSEENLDLLAGAGVDWVVAGSAFFSAGDKAEFARKVALAGSAGGE